MIKLRIHGFSLVVTFGFLFIVCLLSVTDSSAVGFTAAAACIIHELGHCFCAVISNIRIKGIVFWAGGIKMQAESRLVSFRSELAVLLSGPLFNILFSAIFYFAGLKEASAVNLVLALFNLLPYSSLDGGCIIAVLLSGHDISSTLQKWISTFFGIAVLAIMAATGGINPSAAATIILLTADEFTGKSEAFHI